VLEREGKYRDQDASRLAAAQIRNARHVQLPGVDTVPFLGDAEALLVEIEEFLAGARGTADSARSLATVLFTDPSARRTRPGGWATGRALPAGGP
jgi:hypothetical protein